MNDFLEEFFCKGCGREVFDYSLERPPCPNCGSLNITGKVIAHIALGINLTQKIIGKNKNKRKSKGGRFYEETTKTEIYKLTGEPQLVTRIIDYCKNIYYELIVSLKSKEILKEFTEKLSDHQNHGSDKIK